MAWAEPAATRGRWTAHWYEPAPNGRRRHRSHTPAQPDGRGFPSRRAAEDYGEEQEADIRRGRWLDPVRAKTPVERIAWQWHDAKGGQPSTRRTRKSRLTVHIIPRWGTTTVGDVEALDVGAWVGEMVQAGFRKNHIRLILSDFTSIMAAAVTATMIDSNPARGIKAQGAAARPKVALTPEEYGIFWPAFDDYHRELVVAMFATGCRWQEISGMRRRSVDTRAATVAVVPGDIIARGDDGIYGSDGKSKAAGRTITLPNWGLAAFKRQLERHPGDADDLVFRAEKGGVIYPANFIALVWNPVKEQLAKISGLPPEVADRLRRDPKLYEGLRAKLAYLTPHSARHTNATWRVGQGTDIATLMDVMGWGDIRHALPYFHVDDRLRKRSAAGLDSLVGPTMQRGRTRQRRKQQRR